MKHKTTILVSLSYWLFAHSLETQEWVDNGKHKTFQVQGEVCQAAEAGQRQRNHSLYWASHLRGSITSLWKLGEDLKGSSSQRFTWTAHELPLGESQHSTYGIILREENMDARTLSVTARKLWIDDSSLLTTSVCVSACSVVTSYGSLLQSKKIDIKPC